MIAQRFRTRSSPGRSRGGSARFARLMNPSNAINYYRDRTQSIRTRCSKGLTSVRWPPSSYPR